MGNNYNSIYFIRKYKTKNKCFCLKCGNLVFKGHRKGYDYFCPNCQKLLFTNEVKTTAETLDLSDIKQLAEIINKKGV